MIWGMFIVGIREGQSVRIGDRTITAVSVPRPGVVEFRVEGEDLPLTVSCDRKLEIFPDVKITVDRATCYSSRIKLFFEAPRSIVIRELPYEHTVTDHGI